MITLQNQKENKCNQLSIKENCMSKKSGLTSRKYEK